MVNTIVNQQTKLEYYGSCLRTILILFALMSLLTGCNMDMNGAAFTLKNFDEKNYQALLQAIAAVGWLTGLWLIMMGLFKLKVYGQSRTMMSSQASPVPSLMYLFVGTVLFYMPFITGAFLYTIWGSNDVLAYTGKADNAWTTYFQPIVHIMRLIGYVSFIKGWMIWSHLGKEGGQQHGMVGKGFMHILGGILAINFMGTIDIIKHSFG